MSSDLMGHDSQSRIGRPSKGERVQFATRIPPRVHRLIAEDAEADGISQSDKLTEILVAHYSTRQPAARQGTQEEMLRSA
jgi:predicted HicB family RNase H-like nuclease